MHILTDITTIGVAQKSIHPCTDEARAQKLVSIPVVLQNTGDSLGKFTLYPEFGFVPCSF